MPRRLDTRYMRRLSSDMWLFRVSDSNAISMDDVGRADETVGRKLGFIRKFNVSVPSYHTRELSSQQGTF